MINILVSNNLKKLLKPYESQKPKNEKKKETDAYIISESFSSQSREWFSHTSVLTPHFLQPLILSAFPSSINAKRPNLPLFQSPPLYLVDLIYHLSTLPNMPYP